MATSPITSSSASQALQQYDVSAAQKKSAQTREAEQLKQSEAAKAAEKTNAAEKAKAATPPQQAIRTENQNKPAEPTTNSIGQVIGQRINEIA